MAEGRWTHRFRDRAEIHSILWSVFDNYQNYRTRFRNVHLSSWIGSGLCPSQRHTHRPGRAEPSELALDRVPGQGRHGRLAAHGRQSRPHPDVQDPVQHLVHPWYLGNGNRLEWRRRRIYRFVVLAPLRHQQHWNHRNKSSKIVRLFFVLNIGFFVWWFSRGQRRKRNLKVFDLSRCRILCPITFKVLHCIFRGKCNEISYYIINHCLYVQHQVLTHTWWCWQGKSVRFEAVKGNKNVRYFNSSTKSCPMRWLRSNSIKPGQLTRRPVCFVYVIFFYKYIFTNFDAHVHLQL